MSQAYFSTYVRHGVQLIFKTKLYQALPEKGNREKRPQPKKLIYTDMSEQQLLFFSLQDQV